MFFRLSHTLDHKFPCQYQLGKLNLSTDSGWHQYRHNHEILVYKGYADRLNLDDNVVSITQDYQHTGSYCIFRYDTLSGYVSVFTNKWRGFPMWWEPVIGLTNLIPASHQIWTDSEIHISQDLCLNETKNDVIGHIDTTPVDLPDAVSWIHNYIHAKIGEFVKHNRAPIRVFCSGGVDSMMVYSYLRCHTTDLEMVFEDCIQWDYFWCQNSQAIKSKFWAYQQIHHWLDSCVLSSGAWGDEFMLRSPFTADLWLRRRGSSIPIQMQRYPDGLHHSYFSQPNHMKLFQEHDQLSEILDLSLEDFYRYICNIVVNDYQHWHLGRTLTFTPLRDLEIFKIMLRLDLQSGISQIMNSDISRQLISLNDSALLNYLSPTKIQGEPLINLTRLMSDIENR